MMRVLLFCLFSHGYGWMGGAQQRSIRRTTSIRATTTVRSVNVAIVGGGTVGGGIVEILSEKAPFLRDSLGIEAKISKICVRDASRQRDFTLPDGCVLVTDVSEILDDEAVEVRPGCNPVW